MLAYPYPAIRIYNGSALIVAHMVKVVEIPSILPHSQFRKGSASAEEIYNFENIESSDDEEKHQIENAEWPTDSEDSEADVDDDKNAPVPPIQQQQEIQQQPVVDFYPIVEVIPPEPQPEEQERPSSEDLELWEKAEHDEFKQLFAQNVFTIMKVKDLPKGARPIPAKMVYKRKFDGSGLFVKNKARLTACGNFLVRRNSAFSLYIPTIGYEILLLLFALIALLGLYFESWDVSGAYTLSQNI
jgi:hypothetical protein